MTLAETQAPPDTQHVACPDFWKVRLSDIEETLDNAQTGTATTIALSAGGRPVRMIAYGEESQHRPTSNLSAAFGCGAVDVFKDETEPQVVVLVGGVHGAEMEATAGLLNLVQILETEQDFRGRRHDALRELAQSYRILVIPSLNPDGRDRTPDSLHGMDDDTALRMNQGVWKDGSPIGYPTCKRYQPLDPNGVEFLGGYPNDDGHNLMHDATPGCIQTAEVAALLKLVSEERADLVLHMHSHPTAPAILPPNHGVFDYHRRQTLLYRKRLMEHFNDRNLDVLQVPDPDPAATWQCAFNLASLTTLSSGALSPVYEQPNGTRGLLSHDDAVDMSLELVHMFLKWGLREPFAPRKRIARALFDASTPRD